MATQRYTRGQVDNIIRQAELGGDTENTWIKNRRILATQPKCSCDLTTHTCQQQYTSDKGWSEECLPKSPPVYRLSNGGGNPSCMPTSCGDWACADETGCITDTCGGCDIVTCPSDSTEPDLTTPEGITKVTTEFLEQNPVESLASVIEGAGGFGNAWSPNNKDGWYECLAKTETTRYISVWEDGVKITDSYDILEDQRDTTEVDGYSDYIWPGAKYNCKSESWLENPQGIVRIGTGMVSQKAETQTTTCVGGVTHTRVVHIEFFQETASFARFSNHPGCPGMCPRKADANVRLYCRERWWGSWNDLFNNGGGGLFPGEVFWQDGVTGYGQQ